MQSFKNNLILTSITSLVVFSSGFFPALVQAATTNVTAQVSAGTLTLSSPNSLLLSSAAVSNSNGTTTGTVSGISVSDNRGTGAGWTVTATFSNLAINYDSGATTLSSFVRTVSGSPNPGITAATGVMALALNDCQSSFSGTGSIPCGEIKVVVKTVSGSPAKPATVDVYLPNDHTTPFESNITLTANQLDIGGVYTFGSSTAYAVNNEFRIRADILPYAQMTSESSSLAGSGNPAPPTTGMTTASSAAYAGSSSNSTSNSRTLVTAPVNTGMGSYSFNEDLSLAVHSNPLAAGYQATLTYTVS